MRLKITLFLFANILYFGQVNAQSCGGADYEERNGIAVIEAESKTAGSWSKRSISGATGGQALYYNGSDKFNSPGTSAITYKLRVNSPGTYRVIWRNQIGKITNGPEPATSEHNDSWLKINGAEFYGQNGSRRVWPKGSGRTPIVAGASGNGWLKAYTNKLGWTWNTFTNDGPGHSIYVKFNNAGIYNVQISGRSKDHIVDRIVLYKEGSYTASQAQSTSRSATTCSGSTPTPPDPTPPDPTPPANNSAPSVSFSNLSNNQTFTAGANVTVRLSANDSDGRIVKHQIFVNNSSVDTDGTSYTPHIISKIAAGNYTIRATVTDNGGKTASATVNIKVNAGSTPTPPTPTPTPPTPPAGNKAPTVSFTNLSNGQQVTAGSTVSVRVSANDSDGRITKYQVFVNGKLVDTDGSSYTPHPITGIKAGDYTIKVTVTDNKGATGSSTVRIVASGGSTPNPPSPTPTPPTTGGVINFYLINAASNTRIGALANGANISASKTRSINIRAVVPGSTGSVVMTLSGAQSRKTTENGAPYALYGDFPVGDYNSATLKSGSYVLKATAYSGNNGTGRVVGTKTINFTVGSASGKSAFAFPNPVLSDGRVSVRLPEGSAGEFSYSVTNALGVQVEQGKFSADSSQRDVSLELSNVGRQVQGVYYLNLTSKDSKQSIPLIRE